MVNLKMDHLLRCIQTLESSLMLYNQSEPESINREVFRNAIIKGYELIQEISFKMLKKSLLNFGYGSRKLDSTTVKEILRLAVTHGLISSEEVERWFQYRDNRNNTAHDYGEGFAQETLLLLPTFIADSKRLEAVLREKSGHADI